MSHLPGIESTAPLTGASTSTGTTQPAEDDVVRRTRASLDDVGRPVTQRRVIASEWLKFRTLRSTVSVLAVAMLAMVAFGIIVGYQTRKLTGLQPEDAAPSGVLQGYYIGQLLLSALGVLFVTGEYSTGMVRSTFAAVPRRLPVLWGKLVVFALVVATAMSAASVAAFFVGQAVIGHYRPSISFDNAHVVRVVIGTAVYLTLVGLLGGAIGWIIRSTPGGLVGILALILVVPVLFEEFLGNWGKRVFDYLPTGAGQSFSTSVRDPGTLSPWVGLAVMAAWVAAATVVAAVGLRRRDA